MTTFKRFDPWAELERSTADVAKVAKTAKDTDDSDSTHQTLATLATLAGQEETRHTSRYSKRGWRSFYPDLDPSEWEIAQTKRGDIVGRKFKPPFVGVVGFLIPKEKFEPGPYEGSG